LTPQVYLITSPLLFLIILLAASFYKRINLGLIPKYFIFIRELILIPFTFTAYCLYFAFGWKHLALYLDSIRIYDFDYCNGMLYLWQQQWYKCFVVTNTLRFTKGVRHKAVMMRKSL